MPDDDELPALPALDDDGETFGEGVADDLLPGDRSDQVGLDDATAEDDPLEAWGGVITVGDERGLLGDDDETRETHDDDHELLAGAEVGLLEGSDEGDPCEVTAEEAGLLDEDAQAHTDDGGAEGTGEDPALELRNDTESTIGTRPESDEEGFDDAAFEDESAARARASYEREPWPSHADAAWSVEAIESIDDWEAVSERTRAGDVVARAPHDGPLSISFDGGERFVRVPGCASVSAFCVAPTSAQGIPVIAALYDGARESAAIVVVRSHSREAVPHAEVVADLVPSPHDDDAEPSRVDRLRARVRDGALEVLASGPFGHVRIRARG